MLWSLYNAQSSDIDCDDVDEDDPNCEGGIDCDDVDEDDPNCEGGIDCDDVDEEFLVIKEEKVKVCLNLSFNSGKS